MRGVANLINIGFVVDSVLGATKDLSCLHSTSWLVNTDGSYNSIYQSLTDVQSSAYVKVATTTPKVKQTLANPPPPTEVSGWKVRFSTIPNYGRVFTASDITALNSRPKASTDFDNGATSVTAGQFVEFGADIGYNSATCTTSGYWPSGPGCPAAGNETKTFNIFPSPEAASGHFSMHCYSLCNFN